MGGGVRNIAQTSGQQGFLPGRADVDRLAALAFDELDCLRCAAIVWQVRSAPAGLALFVIPAE